MGLFPRDRDLSRAPTHVELEVRACDFRVAPQEVAVRLDAFLAQKLRWRSRTSVQQLIQDGYVRLAPAGPGLGPSEADPSIERRAARILKHGARVVVEIPPECLLPAATAAGTPLTVLYEDDHALVVDKSAGQPVHPSGRHQTNTLIQEVHAHYAQGGQLPFPVRLCHRIDRETSGALLLGKGDQAHRNLRKQFEAREVEKEYLAVVQGNPSADEGEIDLPLGPALGSRVRMKIGVREGGWESRTTWRVLERRPDRALVACRPLTGRQHQIRVHMAALGHPLLGDKLYGPDEELFLRSQRGELAPEDQDSLGLERHALHSHRIAWRCPRTGARREALSPLPADLRQLLS
jgi:23S rRNA pseudouridine1911/1915/1917 synthase